jgi:hypothetical protein
MTAQLGRPKAALVDMDGTLVDVSSIRHYVARPPGEKDFDAFHQASRHCPPIPQALEFCRRHHDLGHIIVVLTARMAMHYDVSQGWLDDYLLPVCPYDGPIMPRYEGCHYSDVVVKRWAYRYLIRNYRLVAACDDNPPILKLWREVGIPEVETVPGWED